ncbi:MAG: glycoside hydrolase domain-containing protein [Phycisphaerae bacterium]
MNLRHFSLIAASILALALPIPPTSLAADEPGNFLITSFEDGPGPVKGDGKIVQEEGKASDGKSSYKIEHKGSGYTGLYIDAREGGKDVLAKFKDYVLFKIDVFNPTDDPIQLGVRVDDRNSKDFGSRFNDERGCTAAPGWSTYQLNLTGLTKSNSKNFSAKERLDINSLVLIKVFVGGGKAEKPITLYFDNLRLEPSNLPKVEGLQAFDFGPSKSNVYPGFEGAGEKTVWKDGAEFGWVKPAAFDTAYIPDDLAGDYGSGDAFNVKVPNGKYIVHTCIDPFGIWGSYPRFTTRTVTICGKEVLKQKMTPAEFLDKCYFLHEDDEDLPGQDLWNKFILPRNVPRRFEADVTDGVLSVKIDSDMKYGKFMQYLVVYPDSRKEEGDKWIEALQKKRHDDFNKKMIVQLPPKTDLPAEMQGGGSLVAFVRGPESYVYVNQAPKADEIGKPMAFTAAKGERTGVQLGLYPLREFKGATVTVSDLAGPDGAKIASSAMTVRNVRNFLKRQGRTTVGKLLPFLLQDFKTLDLKPGITRAVWLTLTVPADAAAGDYTGTVTVSAGDKKLDVPIKVTVLPFALDKITDVTMSATGARSPIPDYWPELKDERWKGVEAAMKDMADHGLNAVTGGVGAKLNSIKDGKADIDYSDMDRWFDLAKKYGLTMPGDGYQGCTITGIPADTRKDCMAKNDAAAKAQFGVSYEELLKAAFGDIDRHAREKGWPVRSYNLLDEPRPEFGNIESALEFIKIHVKAAPGVRFSGYYSDGQGRDDYFKFMPVSISHVNDNILKLVKEAGKELWIYDGSRTRASIGRWMWVAARAGVKGYLTNGYMYVDSDPYFDFSDDEAAWCVAWPGRNGIVDSVPWERVSDGINDYRYLLTLSNLVTRAKAAGKAKAETDAAEAYMKETLSKVDIHDTKSAGFDDPSGYDQFRKEMAKHIVAVKKALGE